MPFSYCLNCHAELPSPYGLDDAELKTAIREGIMCYECDTRHTDFQKYLVEEYDKRVAEKEAINEKRMIEFENAIHSLE